MANVPVETRQSHHSDYQPFLLVRVYTVWCFDLACYGRLGDYNSFIDRHGFWLDIRIASSRCCHDHPVNINQIAQPTPNQSIHPNFSKCKSANKRGK